MGDASAFLAASSLIQGTNSLTSSYAQSRALRSQGHYSKTISEINRNFADYSAADALKRGENAVEAHDTAVKQLMGSQKVALAGQGIDVSSGSAKDILDSTKYLSSLDALTIKANAGREAFGYKVQGLNTTAQGEFADVAGKNAAATTLLTGGLNALGQGAMAGYYFNGGTPAKSGKS